METSQNTTQAPNSVVTDSTVSLIPLPAVEPMESGVADSSQKTCIVASQPTQNKDISKLQTSPDVCGVKSSQREEPVVNNNSTIEPSQSYDIPPEDHPCTSRSTQEVCQLTDHLPLCYALAYPHAVGLQVVDGVWTVYSAADVYLQPKSSANIDTGVILYCNDHTTMQVSQGPFGSGRFDVQTALLSDQDFGSLWVQVSNKNTSGSWIRKGEPIGVLNFQEIRFPNPILVEEKELTTILAQLLQTKRQKKFTTSPDHIPGYTYPTSSSNNMEVFPCDRDTDVAEPLDAMESTTDSGLDLSTAGQKDDSDFADSEATPKRNIQ
ncbi:unnamed protein product [Orchesella dallaii]|uniref:Uncharacterized protein n=1 Tax=Orchesella dallaii TaxID=48710 RepID=A0ABP1RH79_9HEXA